MDFQKILDEAHAAAAAAQKGMVENPAAFDCGFAWVTIDGRHPLAAFCRKRIKAVEKEKGILGRNDAQRTYGDKDYPKGWCFWKPGGSQAQSIAINMSMKADADAHTGSHQHQSQGQASSIANNCHYVDIIYS